MKNGFFVGKLIFLERYRGNFGEFGKTSVESGGIWRVSGEGEAEGSDHGEEQEDKEEGEPRTVAVSRSDPTNCWRK